MARFRGNIGRLFSREGDRVSHIGTFETIENDWNTISRELFGNVIELPKLNKGKNKKDLSGFDQFIGYEDENGDRLHWYDFYKRQLLQTEIVGTIRMIYDLDIKIAGYEVPKFEFDPQAEFQVYLAAIGYIAPINRGMVKKTWPE